MSDMLPPPIYVITDVEVNGPTPGQHSMLAFASVACSERGKVLAEFHANLEEIAGLSSDPDTMEWWHRNPEAREQIAIERVLPSVAIRHYVTWVKSLAGAPISRCASVNLRR